MSQAESSNLVWDEQEFGPRPGRSPSGPASSRRRRVARHGPGRRYRRRHPPSPSPRGAGRGERAVREARRGPRGGARSSAARPRSSRLLDRRFPATARLRSRLPGWSEEDGAPAPRGGRGGGPRRRRDARPACSTPPTRPRWEPPSRGLHEEGRAAADEWPGPPARLPRAFTARPRRLPRLQRRRPGRPRPAPAARHRCAPTSTGCACLRRARRSSTATSGWRTSSSRVRRRLRLVDWEFAGAGEALWDVACFVASCLGAWLSSIPQIPAVSPERLRRRGHPAARRVRPGLAAFWTAYEARRGSIRPPGCGGAST